MTVFVLALLTAHFFGDWIFQSRKMAQAKSKSLRTLTLHVAIVSACIFVAAVPFLGLWTAFVLTAFNGYAHAVIDWFGWSAYKKGWGHLTVEEHFNNYWFYTTIAIDQYCHLAILFLLFL